VGPPASHRTGPLAPDAETFWARNGLIERHATAEHSATPAGAVMILGAIDLPAGQQAQWQEGAAAEDLLDDPWELAADALQALGHPVRLRLLQEVLRGRATARDLADLEGLGTTGQVYHHLRQLVAAGWLRARAGGQHEVPAERLVPLLTTIVGARRCPRSSAPSRPCRGGVPASSFLASSSPLVLDVPFWIDLPALAVLLTLSLVRAPRRDDHPPVAVACPSPGAGPHSTLPPTRCRVTAYGLMAKRSRSTSPTRAPRTSPRGSAGACGNVGTRRRPRATR